MFTMSFKTLNILPILFFFSGFTNAYAQLSYGASLNFGLSKTNPAYTGDALKVRRACDNATVNIGYTSCGDLDTIALNAFAGLQVFPLTSVTAVPMAAYSLRKLNCAYNGFAIGVRSSAAGNPTSNIGFTINGDLDTTALKAFAGTNSVFVSTWYDQSGNGRNVTQATAGNQPVIVNAGIIARQNGKPAIHFISTSSTFLYLNALMMSDKISVSLVAKVNNASARNTLFDLGSIPSGFPDFAIEANTFSSAGNKWGFYSNNNSLDGTVATTNSLTCLSVIAQNTYTGTANLIANTNFYVNGVSSTLSCRSCVTSTYRSSWPNGFVVGNFNGAYVSYTDGYIPELIIFPSLLSTTDRQFLDWTQGYYYGITGLALGTLPAGNLPSAFATTWYDQSGNNHDVVQSTNAAQPRIINTGVVEKLNGFPALTFNGSSQYLASTDAGLPTGNLFTSSVTRANTAASYGSIIHYGMAGTGNGFFATYGTDGNMGTNAMSISQYGDALGISGSASTPIIYSGGRTATTYTLVRNGGSISNKVMSTNTSLYGANGLSIGNYNPSLGGGYLSGSISEVALFPLSFSQTRRILLESNRSAYNTIAVSNAKYTPPSAGFYNLYVNGIGREASTDTVLGTRATVGMGFRSGTSAGTDFLQSDGDYLTCGINCPVGPGTSVLDLPATIVQRWKNDWYVNKADAGTTGGTVKVFFDFSDYGYTGGLLPGIVSNYELLTRPAPSGVFSIVTVVSKAVIGDRVEFTLDASTIIKNNYYTIGTKQMNSSPLPVELLSFTAEPNGNAVALHWLTASETNNAYFTIEKSKNALDFIYVKDVSSKATNGNSTGRLDYKDSDEDPYRGASYYRLKQIALNRKVSYSNIVDVRFDQSSVSGISVFPNPNQGAFTLNFEGSYEANTPAEVLLMDALGKTLYKQILLLSSGTTSFEVIPSQTLAQGMYVLSCDVAGEHFMKKVAVN